jgi:hypothetical protein
MDEPDLDRPGWPTMILIDGEPRELEQTVRQNLQNLATACGSEENVTPEACEKAGLEWRDWSYFVVEMLQHQRWTAEHMASYEANYEAVHGEPPPGIAELRARMRKDNLGLRHLDPEPADDE